MKLSTKLHSVFAVAAVAFLIAVSSQSPFTRASDGHRDDDNRKEDHGRRHQENRFVILLSGVYNPVPAGKGPKNNLGLSMVNLSDGTYSKVRTFPVNGISGKQDEGFGTFYVQVTGMHCAYDLPGGSISAMFTVTNDVVTDYEESPDGSWTLDGTFELEITEATGAHASFVGGHIHMTDILKFRAGDNSLLEDCFCHIHPKLIAP